MEINFFKEQFSFLSNFYQSDITIDGKKWRTVEHYYQAMKTKDIKLQEKIRSLKHPGEAKKYGRKIELRHNWEKVKNKIMREALKAKFNQNKNLQKLLLKTYPDYLIEGNYWHDNTWGICYCKKCENIKGENRLGKLLMKIRNDFIK